MKFEYDELLFAYQVRQEALSRIHRQTDGHELTQEELAALMDEIVPNILNSVRGIAARIRLLDSKRGE